MRLSAVARYSKRSSVGHLWLELYLVMATTRPEWSQTSYSSGGPNGTRTYRVAALETDCQRAKANLVTATSVGRGEPKELEMKFITTLAAAALACGFVAGTANAGPAESSNEHVVSHATPSADATDVSSARRKGRMMRSRRITSGASKAGTGGGSAGQGGSGAASRVQAGAPRGAPSVPTQR